MLLRKGRFIERRRVAYRLVGLVRGEMRVLSQQLYADAREAQAAVESAVPEDEPLEQVTLQRGEDPAAGDAPPDAHGGRWTKLDPLGCRWEVIKRWGPEVIARIRRQRFGYAGVGRFQPDALEPATRACTPTASAAATEAEAALPANESTSEVECDPGAPIIDATALQLDPENGDAARFDVCESVEPCAAATVGPEVGPPELVPPNVAPSNATAQLSADEDSTEAGVPVPTESAVSECVEAPIVVDAPPDVAPAAEEPTAIPADRTDVSTLAHAPFPATLPDESTRVDEASAQPPAAVAVLESPAAPAGAGAAAGAAAAEPAEVASIAPTVETVAIPMARRRSRGAVIRTSVAVTLLLLAILLFETCSNPFGWLTGEAVGDEIRSLPFTNQPADAANRAAPPATPSLSVKSP